MISFDDFLMVSYRETRNTDSTTIVYDELVLFDFFFTMDDVNYLRIG